MGDEPLSQYRRSSRRAVSFDLRVGARLRAQRTKLGLSQARLAKMLGVSFQQVQKYEKGASRISAGRLGDIAEALIVPVQYFYEDADPDRQPPHSVQDNRDVADVGTALARLERPEQRRAAVELIRELLRSNDAGARFVLGDCGVGAGVRPKRRLVRDKIP